MGRYKKLIQPKVVPQNESLPNRNMIKNAAGSYTFQIDDFAQLKRFLILGTESGTYYASAKDLTFKNIEVVRRCINQDAYKTVDMIVEVSDNGLAPKNTPAILALALVTLFGSQYEKAYAYDALPKVCRTATHLFQFVAFRYSDMGGFGRGFRKAVTNWYLSKSYDSLAYQMVKYRNREGFSHKDLLRLAHPEAVYGWQHTLFNWAIYGTEKNTLSEEDGLIWAYEKAKEATSTKEIVKLIKDFNLPREAIPNQFLTEESVWSAMLENGMPLTAMLRNLGNMSKVGLLKPLSESEQIVVEAFTTESIKKARIHPISILMAMVTYAQGHGYLGNGNWPVNQTIVSAMDKAFYDAFGNIEPTGKNILLALDVSGSMTSHVAGMPISSSQVSAAFAMMIKRVEKTAHVVGFSSSLKPLDITPSHRLDTVVQKIHAMTMGATDCAQPMIYATHNNMEVDAFIVITDNETWHGKIHPSVALEEYRKKMNKPDAKLIVLGTTATECSIADPNDAGMLDVAGFSSDVVDVITEFIRGSF